MYNIKLALKSKTENTKPNHKLVPEKLEKNVSSLDQNKNNSLVLPPPHFKNYPKWINNFGGFLLITLSFSVPKFISVTTILLYRENFISFSYWAKYDLFGCSVKCY